MVQVDIKGFGLLDLQYLLLDYNGTIAHDGDILPGVGDLITTLSSNLEIIILTADTYGTCTAKMREFSCTVHVINENDEIAAKCDFLHSLGAKNCAAIGNGRNDRCLLAESAVGVAVIQGEGAAVSALTSADLIAPDIHTALDLFLNPTRLVASLRS